MGLLESVVLSQLCIDGIDEFGLRQMAEENGRNILFAWYNR